jgi:hypothetical protein
VLCRVGGVGTGVLLFFLFYVNIVRSMVSSYVCRLYVYVHLAYRYTVCNFI